MSQSLKGNGLGRGLSSLIPKKKFNKPSAAITPDFDDADLTSEFEREVLQQHIQEISPREIASNPYQPRSDWREDQDFEDLVNSVKKHGILQPLVVTRNSEGKYELVAGERRLRASKKLGLSRVPCIVRSVGQLEKLELALIENIQRKDLNPIERAEAYRKLIDEFSLSHEEAAKRLGKSRPVISNSLRLLQLPPEIQKALAEEVINEGQAKTILELKTNAEQLQLFKKIVKEGMTVIDARRYVAHTTRGNKRQKRSIRSRDADTQAIEGECESIYGTKVRVVRRGKGGDIRIHFFSEEELAALIKKLLR